MNVLFTLLILLGTPNVQALVDGQEWDELEAQLTLMPPESRLRFEGLIAMGRGQPARAAMAFEDALKSTPAVPELHLHAAHAYFQLKEFEAVLRHARSASSLAEEVIAQPLLEARALEALKRHGEAYSILVRACQTFEKEYRPWLELAALAHRRELKSEVRRTALKAWSLQPDRTAAIAIFHLLYGDPDALHIVEQIAAAYPDDPEFRALLGHMYAGERYWFSAARLFEEATQLGGQYAFEAADQYRMAERYDDALRMNRLANAGQKQIKQRISILFEQEQYARIVAMNASVDEPGIQYRLAYSHYAIGEYAAARRHAKALLKTSYRDEASALIQAMKPRTKK